MAYDQNPIPALYKKLLDFYPHSFRERLGESMAQTFEDLYRDRKRQTEGGLFGFVLWTFVETVLGIIREHVFVQGNVMKNILTNPKSAALISFLLCLPLGVPFVALISDIEILALPLNKLLTISGQGS